MELRPAPVSILRVTSVGFALFLSGVGCSDDGSSTDTTTPSPAVATELPIVDQIDEAIVALEAKLGGPQEYFEINATARLINLFVALDGGTVQPWLYFDGELTSEDPAPAEGGTLRSASVDFDPTAIFSKLVSELPGATVESFYIHGDGQGAVQYGALLTTSQGGAIDVHLSSSGEILSSEPLN